MNKNPYGERNTGCAIIHSTKVDYKFSINFHIILVVQQLS